MTSTDGEGIIRTGVRDNDGGGAKRRRHGLLARGRGHGQANIREWMRPDLSLQSKRTPKKETKNQKTPRYCTTTRMKRRMHKGKWGEKHNQNPLGPAG